MKRIFSFIAVTLSCALLAGPGQMALLTVKTPAGGGGGPTTFADTFNRADESPLSGGGNWQTGLGGMSTPNLASNKASNPGGGTSNTGVARVNPATATFAGDHSATVTLVTGWESYVGPAVKVQTDGSCYAAYQDGSVVKVVKINGTAATSAQVGANISVTPAASGQLLKLGAVGDGGSISLTVSCNGVIYPSVFDASSPLTGGQPGIMLGLYGEVDAFNSSDVAGSYTVTGTTLAMFSNPSYLYEANGAADLPIPTGTTITIHTNTGGWVAGTYHIDGNIAGFSTVHGTRNLYNNTGQWGGSTDSITGGSYTLNP